MGAKDHARRHRNLIAQHTMPNFNIPAKTFMMGEYAILQQHPAIGIATPPLFACVLDANKVNPSADFHPQSPAGRYLARCPARCAAQCLNPHQLGGLGQSSAAFLTAWLAHHHPNMHGDFNAIMDAFHASVDGTPYRPSGMDVATQLLGEVTLFDGQTFQSMSWPFKDVGIGLWHTGITLPTHDHLKTLRDVPNELGVLAKASLSAFCQHHAPAFIETIKDYQMTLHAAGLQADHIEPLLNHLQKHPNILACKGCGAMGSDVVLALFDWHAKDDILQHVAKRKLRPLFVGQQLAHGLLQNLSHAYPTP